MSATDYQQQALQFQPEADLLRGRVIAITGAGDGIGRALALAVARHGAEVVLIGRTVKRLEAVHAEIEKIRRQKRKRSRRAQARMLDAKSRHSEKKAQRRNASPE